MMTFCWSADKTSGMRQGSFHMRRSCEPFKPGDIKGEIRLKREQITVFGCDPSSAVEQEGTFVNEVHSGSDAFRR